MIRLLLKFLGYKLIYTCSWGNYNRKYDGVDRMMARPIHADMSVAPPWAKLKIIPIKEK